MIKIAWRNLWRRGGRTWITIAAIAITYALYLVTACIQEYTYISMIDAAAKAAGGEAIVQGAGFQDSQLNDVVIPNGADVMATLGALEGVEQIAPRVILNGLLSTSASSSAASIRGIDPNIEHNFQDMTEYLREGTFLADGEDKPIVLGSEIVKELEANLGDRIIFTATGADGEMKRALFYLTGVLHTGSKMTDRGLAYTTVPAAQKAMSMGDSISQVGMLGNRDPEALVAAAKAALADQESLEVLTWAEAMPDIVGLIEMDRAWADVFAIVLFIVVLFAIMNTFLMAVMERVRELGLLRALGLTPGKVGLLVLLETLLLTVVAMAIGLTLGTIGHLALDTYGINMLELYGMDSMDMGGISITDPMIYSELNPQRWFSISMSVLFMVLFSAAYPAYKAGRMRPSEAMRFYE